MPKEISKDIYENEVLKAKKPVILEIFTTWCGKCQQMKPIFEELEQEHGDSIQFYVVDADKERELVEQLGITGVPTFLFFKDGKLKATEHGYMPKEDLAEKIKQHFS